MATMISGLGGSAGYGEQSFKTATVSGNLDDGFVNVNVTSIFGSGGMTVGGTGYTSLFISSNGLITFGSGVTTYTPSSLTSLGQPSLAPFWTDIDISKGGDIYWDLDPVNGRITITWLNVAPYTGTGQNSFQVILTSTGSGDFTVEYIYENIGFTNGYAGHATTGFYDGTTQTLLEGSGDPAMLSTYATNDFDTNDPAGVYGLGFEGGSSFAGDGIVDGTSGNDVIGAAFTGDPDGDRVDGEDATGFAGTTGHDDYIRAGAGDDTVNAGLGNDIVFGDAGRDAVFGGYGADTLSGGAGNDSVDGGSGNDSLSGGDGDDTLVGGAGAAGATYAPVYTEVTLATQEIAGTSGRPEFTVRTWSNESNLTTGSNSGVSGFRIGNGDSNELHTHMASSRLAGGQVRFNGLDSNEAATIQIDGVTVNLATAVADGRVSFNGGGVYGINGSGQIVRIAGTGSNPSTIGTLTINVLYTSVGILASGSNSTSSAGFFYEYFVNTQPLPVAAEAGGDDLLSGGAGNDLLEGGDGNDTLAGGEGSDQLTGGAGVDVADYSGSASGVTVDLAAGSGSAGDAAGDSLAGIEALAGSAQDDRLFGDGAGNTLSGGAGDDSLDGRGGDDRLYGGAGQDSLVGGAGDDLLSGDEGNDRLEGGEGADTIIGGAGADTLVGGNDGDVVDGGDGNDTLDLSAWGWRNTNVVYDAVDRRNGSVQFLNQTGAVIGTMQFQNVETVVPCFTPGTRITTRRGEVAVEDLRAGDAVLTRDNGFCRLLWTGRRRLERAALLSARDGLCPVRIRAGALGNGVPARDMMVSPQHRMLLQGLRAELLFGEPEVLVAATHLTGLDGVDRVCPDGVTYVHILFDGHEIVCADGAWSESFQPARPMVDAMDRTQAEEILQIFPALATSRTAFDAARLTLKSHEARALLAA